MSFGKEITVCTILDQSDTYICETLLQLVKLSFFDDNSLIIEVFDDEVVEFLIDLVDDGFDARVTLDQNSSCCLWHIEVLLVSQLYSQNDLSFVCKFSRTA